MAHSQQRHRRAEWLLRVSVDFERSATRIDYGYANLRLFENGSLMQNRLAFFDLTEKEYLAIAMLAFHALTARVILPSLSRLVFMLLMTIVFSAGVANAAVFTVTTAEEFQAALSTAAGNGAEDEILLGEGLYLGNFKYIAQDSTGLKISGAGRERTVLDGDQRAFVIFLSLGEQTPTVELSALTIKGGFSQRGSALRVDSDNTEPFFNWNPEFHSVINLKSMTISGNKNINGIGGSLIAGVGIALSLLDVEMAENQSEFWIQCMDSCLVSLSESRFVANFESGATTPRVSVGAIEVEDSFFSGLKISSVSFNGGPSGTGCSVLSSKFRGRSALDCSHKRFVFSGNDWNTDHSFIILKGEKGEIENNSILEATLEVQVEEGLSFKGNLVARKYDSIVAKTISVSGYQRLDLLSNTFARLQNFNLTPALSGANHTLANNIFDFDGVQDNFPLRQTEFPEKSQIFNNILPSGDIGYWDEVAGNIQSDPMFFNVEDDDFHVRPDSPAVNSGSNNKVSELMTSDLDGNRRILEGTVDIGAYERNTTGLHPADTNGDSSISSEEFGAYNTAWRTNETWPTSPSIIPVDYVTRAGYLLQKGGAYENIGVGKPATWMPLND